jgi:hypothetical protein
LQRTEANVEELKEEDSCKDPLVMLACALETDECPAACKGEKSDPNPDDPNYEVKAGDMDFTISNYSSSVVSVPSVGTVIFANIDLKANKDSVRLREVTLERVGLGNKNDIK